MIVATAGHVDHGKTSLVTALTGIDTDRLDEEKRRGMTIDLGFAHADLGDGTLVGFVDVPGHERFIRNMVAGVASVDLALLVIAADDGPMPQTIEHLAILEWLGVRACIVALTKVDRVSDARLAEVGRGIEALLAAGPFRDAAIVPVATPSGHGIDALKGALREAASGNVAKPVHGHFRLAVDRSFVVAGAGLVVAGTVVAGAARVGDALLASPRGLAVRVRAIERHGKPADRASTGQRCALNLAGLDVQRGAIERGDWIVAAHAHRPTDRIDVRLEASSTLARSLRQGASVQLHLAAATVPARLALLDRESIEPGHSALAQLVLERAIGALHGDRFVIRNAAENRTLGGGRVIDPFGPARGRSRPERRAELEELDHADAATVIAARLARSPEGFDLAHVLQARNLTAADGAALLADAGAILVDSTRAAVAAPPGGGAADAPASSDG
ncbi:MAG: selenocysteine-specific translation elongation factor, partial [Caldimonas sp.]